MPEFVEFSREDSRSRREDPQFTWQARGLLSFNRAAFQALGEPEAVTLLYDAKEGIVALRKADSTHPNAHPVRKQQNSHTYRVGAQGFAAYNGIQTLKARRFIGHDYHDGVWGFALREGVPVQNRRGAQGGGPAVTSRWRTTNDGGEVPALMRIGDVAMSHPGSVRPQHDKPPSVRIGILVACDPLGENPPTSELRSRFLRFLAEPPIMELVMATGYVPPGWSWTPWAGRGRFNSEAVLTGHSQDTSEAPAASALMLLPETGTSSFGRDPRFAELVIDIDWRSIGGSPKPGAPLAFWHNTLVGALDLPRAFAQFLTDDLGLDTSAAAPAQLGVWLKTPHDMRELVDIGGLLTLPGAHVSNWYIGYAIAESSGDTAATVAVKLLRQMCDYTIPVLDYEPQLAIFDNA